MDVCITKDKQVVVIHDPELSRICGIEKFVKDFNYDELPLIQEKLPLDFSDQIYDTSNEKDRKIPLLEDVCKELSNILAKFI